MSLRVIQAEQRGYTPIGTVPCLVPNSNPDDAFARSGVRLNEELQIIFTGVPPYNLTQMICEGRDNCRCGSTVTNLTDNYFNWTVGAAQADIVPAAEGRPVEIFRPNQSMIWIAIEQNRTATDPVRYFASRNYSLSDRSYDLPPEYMMPPESAGTLRLDKSLGLAGWAVVWLAMFISVLSV